jgi:SAM-dependent methyltransferase
VGGSFLDQLARIGISVHLGGRPATRRLLELTHVAEAREVLDVGCGIGVGPASIARDPGCRVVGLDRSPRMIEWARARARDQGLVDRVELVVGDVLALPFEDGRFDAVIAESVLAFVEEKERAIAEMVRVARSGGWVGLNETFLLDAMPSPRVAALANRLGTDLITLDAWRALWKRSGLTQMDVYTGRIGVARELRDRFRWVGPRRLVAGSFNAVRLYMADATERPMLELMRDSLSRHRGDAPGEPPPWASFGFGLFVGRKPAEGGQGS